MDSLLAVSYDREIVVELGEGEVHYGYSGQMLPIGTLSVRGESAVYHQSHTSRSDFETTVLHFWERILNGLFLISTSKKRITVIGSPFFSDDFIHTSTDVLVRFFRIEQVRFQRDCVLPLLPLGTSSGLVIDVDYETTTIYTVGYGVVDLIHSVSLPKGVHVMENSANVIAGDCLFPSPHLHITSVASLEDSPSDLSLERGGKQYAFTADQRRAIASSLFPEGPSSISYSICSCLLSVPADVLRSVLAHSVLIGDGGRVCEVDSMLTRTVKEMVGRDDKFRRLRGCIEPWEGIVAMKGREKWRGYCVAESLQLQDKAISRSN